jgi:ABC-type glutathione transport system ATPase component
VGKGQMLNQLQHLEQTLGVSDLFIGHDLATVAHISHQIAPIRKEAAPRGNVACRFN